MHSRPHRCSTNFWAAAVTLALGQRTSIVSSYQNHASPQPRTAASHCDLDNVSNVKKYKKSHCAFWESQDIVHTVTFRGAMVVYNRTITEKFTTNYFTSSGTPPSGWWGEKRSRPRSRWRTPRAPLNNLTWSYARKYIQNEVQQLQFYEKLRNNKISLRAQGNPFRPPEESHAKSGSRQGRPELHHTNSIQTTSNVQGKI